MQASDSEHESAPFIVSAGENVATFDNRAEAVAHARERSTGSRRIVTLQVRAPKAELQYQDGRLLSAMLDTGRGGR